MTATSNQALVDHTDQRLPQTQCTLCGYPRCREYAEAIERNKAEINQCPPGGEITIGALAKLLDKPVVELNPEHGKHEPKVLVYNPVGPQLPPDQAGLQLDYKTRLQQDFGIEFNNLLTINRFRHFLRRTGQLESYERLLADNFNPATIPALMCRNLISVDWQGYVYDCDFNQMLGLALLATGKKLLWDIDMRQLQNQLIAVGSHCYGCTAGAGSSCGGPVQPQPRRHQDCENSPSGGA